MNEIVTWTDDRIEQLRKLWDQGLSASAIGRQLGVSKNAVVGKAHRLKLPARPSPIRKGARPPVRRMAVLPKPFAMPVRRHHARPSQALAELTEKAEAPAAAAERPAAPPPLVQPTRRVARGIKACLWPIGDPGEANFHFCGAEVVPGKSYCSEHCQRAYIHKSRADSEAA
ncbi:MAG TPA: GcrA family cell cycle regulator [Kiloniellales bacterium]|nr:GcrA family cell cycle regulator [Kiloniellales bacterium]